MCQKVWIEESKVGNDIIILRPQKKIIVKMDTMLSEYRIGGDMNMIKIHYIKELIKIKKISIGQSFVAC